MAVESQERLVNELKLLESMYPEQILFDSHSREVTYAHDGASLHLRLPDRYLDDEIPEVLAATSATKEDLRNQVRRIILESCVPGEETLDSVILSFNEINELVKTEDIETDANDTDQISAKACIIVWLHHLLNTNKRKQVLSPSSSDVSGITKPGYPGVLIFSGSAHAVQQHVSDLKQLNWQAFQVRMESDEEWTFAHGTGIVEVEAMKDVVAEIGENRKQDFMAAMRMK